MLRLVDASGKAGNHGPEQSGVVIRKYYRHELSALDDLVELLHQLLIDESHPASPDSTSAGQGTTCFRASTE